VPVCLTEDVVTAIRISCVVKVITIRSALYQTEVLPAFCGTESCCLGQDADLYDARYPAVGEFIIVAEYCMESSCECPLMKE
jgi:hypothetical protein